MPLVLCLPQCHHKGVTRRELVFGGFLGWPWFGRGDLKACGARFRRLRNGSRDRRYLTIHGDESTARDVLTAHMRQTSGTAYVIQNNLRTLRAPNGLEYDPNRMFTTEGLSANLVTLNPKASEAARAEVVSFIERDRNRLMRSLLPPRNDVLIVLHNNARGYSVKDELELSDKVSLVLPNQPNEFMLCTNPEDFERLRTGPHNVVLQQHPKGKEDGSLSRLAARQGIRYVNIEAFLGREAEQRAMLAWVEQRLSK